MIIQILPSTSVNVRLSYHVRASLLCMLSSLFEKEFNYIFYYIISVIVTIYPSNYKQLSLNTKIENHKIKTIFVSLEEPKARAIKTGYNFN